jgi:hypothetical protein
VNHPSPRHGPAADADRHRPPPWAEAGDEDGEARYVPRHLAPRASARRLINAASVPYLVLATVVAVLLATVGVLASGSGSHGGADDGDTIAAVSDTTGPGSGSGSGSGDGAVPSVERPARPAGAPELVEVPPSAPVSVEIPSVGISSLLEHLAMGDDGVLAAPVNFGTAGWFAAGPQPGQPGPAVIAGHVDSRSGPAIFYRLNELKPGDEVLVHREDGSTVRFAVDEIEQYPKDAFPADAVYGPVPGPELRLITCGGEFDRTVRSYRDNLVVYASAVGT